MKLDLEEGWVHLKKNTEPIIRVYAEAPNEDAANALAGRFKSELQSTVKQIYLDNAATCRLQYEAVEAMIPVLTDVFGNLSSSHATGRKAKALIELQGEIAKRLGL